MLIFPDLKTRSFFFSLGFDDHEVETDCCDDQGESWVNFYVFKMSNGVRNDISTFLAQ